MHETASSLARALGVSKQQLSRYRKNAWFPALPCATETAQNAIRKHAKRALRKVKAPGSKPAAAPPEKKKPAVPKKQPAKKPAPAVKAAPPPEPPPPPAASANPSPLRKAEDPVAIVDAALRVARDRLARAHEKHRDDEVEFGARDFEDLRRCISELGVAREEAEAIGQLVSRDATRWAVATVSRRWVEAFERLMAQFSKRLDAWLGDPDWRAMSQKARHVIVHAWAERVVAEARVETADDIEKLIVDARRELESRK